MDFKEIIQPRQLSNVTVYTLDFRMLLTIPPPLQSHF